MDTRLEVYAATVVLNTGQPAEYMLIIENEDSYLCVNKELFTISFDKPLKDGVIINKLDNICYLTFNL